ncbi:alpha/beta fold hydrolase [Amycolatopsis sp. FU40]|nr:alpha/beta fold hydrolase [Amycolatopsis sp. FU40]UKD51724.1 alpha/beta fold hydrolase [Amycolatopsis sp. FU40]
MSEITESTSWVRRFHPAPDAPARLVCFPHAGGSASFYFPMSKALSGDLDVLNLQYPGRQDRRHEPVIADLGRLADETAEVLRPWLDRPVAFFGHSMGAVLAFETALRLEREHAFSPVRLFASGRRAPSTSRDESVHLRDDEGILAELKLMSGTDARLLGDEEILRMSLPAIRGDYQAVETYQAEPAAAVRCPIDVLTGDDDPKTTIAEARAWQEHTTGGFDLTVFAGGHFFLAHHQKEITAHIRNRTAAVAR